MTNTFKPVVYAKHTCPFSLKVRVFLLDAGQLDRVEPREAFNAEGEEAIRHELSGQVPKISYPTVRFGDGDYPSEPDDIIARFAEMFDGVPATLPTSGAYVDGSFQQLIGLYKEAASLRERGC